MSTASDPSASAFPNLTALVGRSIAIVLVQLSGGSLAAFCGLNDAAVRQLGVKELMAAGDERQVRLQSSLQVSPQLLALLKQLQLGYLALAPLLREAFSLDSDDVHTLVNANALKKAVGVLSRKALLAARTDQGGGSGDGAAGVGLREEVAKQVVALHNASSTEAEVKALPVPEFFEKHEDGRLKKRGGRKAHQVQVQIAKRKGVLLTDAEAARLNIANEIRYSSTDAQEERLNSREVRALELAEQQKRLANRKRAREEEEKQLQTLGAAAPITGTGAFDDLFGAVL